MRRLYAGERGVALALVLWLVVILGATAAAVVGSSRRATNVLLNARSRTVARHAAESGIIAAVALVERNISSGYTPEQQARAFVEVHRELAGLQNVPLGAARFAVALTSLSGRLDLNQADPEALVGLFSQFTSAGRARSVVDALLDWRDADDLVRARGAEAETYRRAGSPFVPPNAPLTRLEEFGRVMGVSDSLALAVAPYITVTGESRIDVNAAPEPVLAALPGIGPSGARTLVSRRSDRNVFTSLSEVLSLLGPAAAPYLGRLTVAPTCLLLVSRGWMAGHPLTHEIQAAYIVIDQGLLLRSWRERDL